MRSFTWRKPPAPRWAKFFCLRVPHFHNLSDLWWSGEASRRSIEWSYGLGKAFASRFLWQVCSRNQREPIPKSLCKPTKPAIRETSNVWFKVHSLAWLLSDVIDDPFLGLSWRMEVLMRWEEAMVWWDFRFLTWICLIELILLPGSFLAHAFLAFMFLSKLVLQSLYGRSIFKIIRT